MSSTEHLVPLASGWSVWKWVLVRGAGFPVGRVLALAAPELARTTELLAAKQDALGGLREQAAANLRAMLATTEADARRAVDKALKLLQKGRPLVAAPELAEVPALAAVLAAERAIEADQAHLVTSFAAERLRTARAVRDAAADPRFREAVMWQNRRALVRAIDWLNMHPEETNTRARQNQHLVASYLQRYCVKNDTIGFFGPVGWGLVTDAPTGVTTRPGPALLTKRTVYFEHWCIDAVADLLGQDSDLAPIMRPRRMPTARLEGALLFYPVDRRSELPIAYARLFAACDGVRTAREIATELVADATLELMDEGEVFDMLRELVAKRVATWAFEVPTVGEWPERELRAQLAIAEPVARARAIAILDELDRFRAEITASADDPQRLEKAMSALETHFEQLVSRSATRRSGETYAARTLVYEDCVRGLEVELGSDFRARLGPPLALILQSARWYTYRLAELYRAALSRAFDAAVAGSASVDYLTFWHHAKELFPAAGHSEPVAIASQELALRWTTLVGFDPALPRQELTVAELAPRVADVFAAPHYGWPSARFHSPDVLIAARDAASASAGTIVLGEIHPSVCTIHHLAQKEHPDRAALVRAREVDLPEVIPAVVYAKEHATRADHMWVSHQDVDLELGTTRSRRDRDHVIAIGSLVVERDDDGSLRAREREGTRSFDIIELFGGYLNAAIANEFDMFPVTAHAPRITIDGVVVARERWRPARETWGFASEEDPALQFLAARRWARAHGMPRWVFVKVPEEPKPVYIDFDSPLYVEALAKLLRKASRVTVGEMLPSPDETWLPDAAGQTYTCELRLVAVDPTRWPSS